LILSVTLWIVVGLFPASEIALSVLKRSNQQSMQAQDRGSLRMLWLAISLGVGGAIAAQWIPFARIPVAWSTLRMIALVLLLAGLALRWVAILTLGKLFTVDVAIHTGHSVVESGLYRFVRHPSYTGLLLAFLGLGVAYANWLSIIFLLVPITLAVVNRVIKEENALLAALGAPYAEYCSRTKRFIPKLL
jgi:protein-S-isoprenylcysteine O-methyltransferase